MTRWSDIARQAIERAALSIPETASLKERKATIDAAYPFAGRSHWPYKAWLKARRSYLSRYGYGAKAPARWSLLDLMERDPETGRPVIR